MVDDVQGDDEGGLHGEDGHAGDVEVWRGVMRVFSPAQRAWPRSFSPLLHCRGHGPLRQPLDLRPRPFLGGADVIGALQVEPEARLEPNQRPSLSAVSPVTPRRP